MAWYDIILCFVVYSFIGWGCECIYCSLRQGKLVDRGFLTGSLCPIYGFGALAMLCTAARLPNHQHAIFLGGMLVTSALEYISSWGIVYIHEH